MNRIIRDITLSCRGLETINRVSLKILFLFLDRKKKKKSKKVKKNLNLLSLKLNKTLKNKTLIFYLRLIMKKRTVLLEFIKK